MDEKVKQYHKYYENQFSEIIGLPKLRKIAIEKKQSWLSDAVDRFDFRYSSIWRYENLATMKYLMPVRKTDFICTVFKISRLLKKIQTITSYAVMYSHVDENKIIHDYVAISPTYKSADGEYRHRFLPVSQVLKHRQDNSDIYSDVETMITEQAVKQEVSFQTYSFLPDQTNRSALDDSINNNRLILIFYAAEWFMEYTRLARGRSENHITAGYHASMFGESDVKVWDKYEDLLSDPTKSGIFFRKLVKIVPNMNQKLLISEMGQKIIPLTVRDVELSDDIRLAPWREMYITSRASDLVINGICAGVPLMNDWFFIRGMSKEMYDNAVSHVKLNHSEVASDIIKKLEESRKSTYVIDPIKKNEIYISYRMEGFSNSIEIPMDYAEKELVLAPYVLVVTEEHLGRTVADVPSMMMFEDYALAMGPIFKDFHQFSKYIFEFLYTLGCLNQIGIIHGDLHLNNCTIYEMRAILKRTTNKLDIPNPHMIYETGSHKYIFPTYGRSVALIDFSRAFIWNADVLRKDYNDNQIKAIQTNYKKRMLDVMRFEFSDFIEAHKNYIELAIERHFDDMYKIFQVVDIWKIMSGWEIILQSILNNHKQMQTYGNRDMLLQKAMPLVISIKDAAYDFFTKHIQEILENPNRLNFDITNPSRLFILEFFSAWTVDKFKSDPENPITLVDYYSDKNELRYNVREYDKFPPNIKFDYVKKHKLDLDDYRLDNYELYEKYLNTHDPAAEVLEISQTMIDGSPGRRGTPAIKITKEPAALAEKLKLQIASSDDIYFST